MEKSISKVKIFLMTIVSLVIMLTGVTFVRLDKNQSQSQSPTVVSAATESEVPEMHLPEGANDWSDVFSLNTMADPDVSGKGYGFFNVKSEFIERIEEILFDPSVYNNSNLTHYKVNSFSNLPQLKTIVILGNVDSTQLRLGSNIFDGCPNLEKIYFNAPNVTILSSNAFSGSYGTATENGCELIIGSNVTSIPDNMFKNATSITSVTIPSSVTQIGINAFANCTKLQELNYDASVVHDFVSDSAPFAFSGDRSGVFVKIGSNVPKLPKSLFYSLKINQVEFLENSKCTSIGTNNFYGSNFLAENLILPDSVTTLESFSIAYASRLKNIKLGTGLTYIANDAFLGSTGINNITYNCTTETPFNLTSIFASSTQDIHLTIGADVTAMPIFYTEGSSNGIKVTELTFDCKNIPAYACYRDAISNVILKKINLSKNVQNIGDWAFAYCCELLEINIPEDSELTTIGEFAFGKTQIERLTIPSKVTTIGVGIVWYASNLSTIYFNAKDCQDIDNLYWDEAGLESVIIGSEVTRIPANFFKNADTLTTLTIDPDCELTEIGTSAFEGCTSLTEITIPENVTKIGTNAFSGCSDVSDIYFGAVECEPFETNDVINGTPTTTVGSVFKDIGDVAVHFGNYTKTVPAYFGWDNGNTRFTSITLEQSIETIGMYAFYCGTFTEITLPGNITSIDGEAFDNCPDIKTVYYNCAASLDISQLFSDSSSMELIIGAGAGVPEIYKHSNYSNSDFVTLTYAEGCATIQTNGSMPLINTINIPASATSIANNAFQCSLTNCSASTVNFAEGSLLQTIGNYAFDGCSTLVNFNLGNLTNLKTIGHYAFNGCSALTTVTIPESVTYIGAAAFRGCSEVTTINYNAIEAESLSNITYYNDSWGKFSNCTLNIGVNVTVIPFTLFAFSKVQIVNFAQGSVCKTIEDQAFYHSSITSINLPDSIETIGFEVFTVCTNLQTVVLGAGLQEIYSDNGGKSVFEACFNITSITYNCTTTTPLDLTKIFADSTQNIHLTIGENVTTMPIFYTPNSTDGIQVTEITFNCTNIPVGACRNNYILKTINIGPTVETIGADAFNYADYVTSINMSNATSLTTIGDNAFSSCSSFGEITIPKNVKNIGAQIFYGTYSIRTINFNAINCNDTAGQAWMASQFNFVLNIGSEVTRIPGNLFTGSLVTAVCFEDNSIKEIGDKAFQNCTSLTSFPWAWTYGILETIGESAFEGCTGLTQISIADSLETIGAYAFKDCSNVTNIYYYAENLDAANDSTTSSNLGSADGCTVHIGSDVTKIADNMFKASNVSEVVFDGTSSLETIGRDAFFTCISLTNFDWDAIKNTLISIEDSAFEYCGLSNVILPDSLESIGSLAFGYNNGFTTITIPENVKDFEVDSFAYCGSLKTLYFNATNCNDCSSSNNLMGLSGVTVYIGANVTRIPANCFGVGSSDLNDGVVAKLIFAENSVCTEIGANAFNRAFNNRGHTSIVIPASVTTIGDGAFANNYVFDSTINPYFNITMLGSVNKGTRSAIPTLASTTSLGVTKLYVPLEDYALYMEADKYGNTDNVARIIPYGYSVTFDLNDGSGNTISQDLDINEDGSITTYTINVPTRQNFTFAGWYTDPNFDDDSKIELTPTADGQGYQYSLDVLDGITDLYAKWDADPSIDWSIMYTYNSAGDTITGINETNAAGLVDFVIPVRSNSGTDITKIGENAFRESRIQSVTFAEGSQLRVIDNNAFYGSNLEDIDFTNATSLEYINAHVFNDCKLSGVLELPSSIIDFGFYPFKGTEITGFTGLEKSNPAIGDLITIDGYIYRVNDDNTLTLMVAPAKIEEENAHVVLDSRTTIIDDYVFYGCQGIKSIYGENVTTIKYYAFWSSTLEYFDFPKLVEICGFAFDQSNLKTIQLAPSVTIIGAFAFSGNPNLTSIVIDGSLSTNRTQIPTIGDNIANNPSDITVYVAREDLDTYKADANWSQFKLVGVDTGSTIVRKVTIDLDGGSGYSSAYYIVEGETIDLSVNPTKLGYSFSNWSINGTNDVDYAWAITNKSISVYNDLTITANWNLIEYKVYYHINGGTINGQSDNVVDTFTIDDFGAEYNTAVSVKEPTREGYTFIGWYTKNNFDSAKVTSIKFEDLTYNQLMGLEDINLYAKWEIMMFEMQFEQSHQYTIGLDANTYNPVSYGNSFGFTILLAEGYTQNNRADNSVVVKLYDESHTYIRTLTATPSATSYLHYVIDDVQQVYRVEIEGIEINTYNVHFVTEFGDWLRTLEVSYGNTLRSSDFNETIEPTDGHFQGVPSCYGYEFDSWHLRIQDAESERIDANSIDPYNMNIYGDTTFVAKLKLIPHNCYLVLPIGKNIYINGVPYDSISDKPYTITVGQTFTLPVDVTRDGYTFVGWAVFECYDVATDEWIIPIDYEFNTWTSEYGDNGYFYGAFTRDTYIISYQFNGGGYADTYTTEYNVKTPTFDLITPTKTGYTFGGWYTDSAMTHNRIDAIELGSTGNLTLYAKWNIIEYDITYHLNGSTLTPVKIDGTLVDANVNQRVYNMTYQAGMDDYTLFVPTRIGYTFGGWYDNDEFTGNPITSIPCSELVSDREFYAKWDPKTITVTLDKGYIGGFFTKELTVSIEDLESNGGAISLSDMSSSANASGYTFLGWLNPVNNQIIQEITLADFESLDGVTLVAQCEAIKFNVTLIGGYLDGLGQVLVIYDSSSGQPISSVQLNDSLDFRIESISEHATQCIGELTVSYSYSEDGEYTPLTNYLIEGIIGDIFIKVEGVRYNKYTLEFVSNGGTPVNSITKEWNAILTEDFPQDPTRDGYTFAGWYRSPSLQGEQLISQNSLWGNTVVYAKWEPVEYELTLETYCAGESTDATYAFDHDDKDSLKLNSKVSDIRGYEFKGFYLVPENATEYTFSDADLIESLDGVYRDAVVIARYELITYRIYYGIDYGSNHNENPSEYTVKSGEIEFKNPTKDGYNFICWWLVKDNGNVTITTINPSDENVDLQDLYIVAQFKIDGDHYNVQYMIPNTNVDELPLLEDSNGIIYIAPKGDKGWKLETERPVSKEEGKSFIDYDGKSCPTFNEINIIKGYEFVGWYYDEKFEKKLNSEEQLTDHLKLYAKFKRETYKITYYANIDKWSNPDTNIENVNITHDFNLADASSTGYNFEGWFTDVTILDNGVYDFTNAKEVTRIVNHSIDGMILVAKFTPKEYTIVYNLNGGILKDNVELIKTYYITDGTIILPTAEQISKPGYTFDGWETGAGEIIEQITMNKISNYTLTAKFTAIEYTVTFVDEKAEAPEDIKYTIESSVQTLSHEGGEAGYVFIGWYDENDHKVEYVGGGHIVGDTLTAKYNLIPYYIDYNTNGGELEDQDFEMIRKYYVTSSIIVLPKLVQVGYTFDGWTNVANPSKVINSIDPTTCTNYELIAKFTAIEYTVTFVDDKLTPPADLTYTIESPAQVLDHGETGYNFEGWFDAAGNKVETIGGGMLGKLDLTARYATNPTPYDIEYDLKDGTMPNGSVTPITYTVEDEIILSSPSKPGFTFLYWKDKNTQKILEDNKIKNMFGLLALEAVYKEFTTSVYYKITYIVDGDERVIDYIEHNGTLKDVVIPEKSYYNFVGLFLDPGCTTAIDPNMKVTQDIQLYLKYAPIDYNIDYKYVDVYGTVLTTIDDPNNKFNIENQIVFEKPNFFGYTFEEFKIDNQPVKSTLGYYKDIEVIVVFKETVCKIAYILNGGTQNSRNLSEYTIKNEHVRLYEPTRYGYEFDGWVDSETNMKVTVIDADSLKNYTLIAKWKDPNAAVGTTSDNNIGTIIAIAVIGAIIVFAGIGVVLMIKMKHSSVTIKSDKDSTNIHDINAVYNMEKKQYNMTEENRRRYESNLEKRNEQKEVGKFLGGTSNNNNDPYRNHGSVPHNIPSNPQNNVNNNTNGSNDQNNNNNGQ